MKVSEGARRVLGVAMLGLVLAGCGSSGGDAAAPTTAASTTTSVPTKTIVGTIGGTTCSLLSPSGLLDGDPVVVTDGAGKQLAVGKVTGEVGDRPDRCIMQWKVKGVPEGASGYKVIVDDNDAVEFTWYELTHDAAIESPY